MDSTSGKSLANTSKVENDGELSKTSPDKSLPAFSNHREFGSLERQH
jgi:hypothetical protein